MEKLFAKIASKTAHLAGKPITSIIAFLSIVIWGVTGPVFGFSDTWQLIINTATTILTFLMVFVIQNSQNRDGLAIQAKLDEIIHNLEGARDDLEHVEEQTEQEIESLRR